MSRRPPDALLSLLASNSPVTFDQLQQALQASRATTFRHLRQIPYLRSYNHNGRFYTRRDPARFDRFGLFSIGDVHFSRDRSLSKTVRRLVSESADGCTDRELRSLLQVPVPLSCSPPSARTAPAASASAASTSISPTAPPENASCGPAGSASPTARRPCWPPPSSRS